MRGCESFSNEVADGVADGVSMLIVGVIKMVSNELSDGSEEGVDYLILQSLGAASNESFFVISI